MDVSGDVLATIIGAITVAAITAHTTNRRLDRQLSHERVENDRAELRSSLDQAAAAAVSARNAAASASGAIEAVPGEVETVETFDYRAKAVTAVFNAMARLSPEMGRLTVRLSEDHPASAAYWTLMTRGNELTQSLPEDLPATDDVAADVMSKCEAFALQTRVFLGEANAIAGTRET